MAEERISCSRSLSFSKAVYFALLVRSLEAKRVQWFMHEGGSEVFVGILVVKLKAAEAMGELAVSGLAGSGWCCWVKRTSVQIVRGRRKSQSQSSTASRSLPEFGCPFI